MTRRRAYIMAGLVIAAVLTRWLVMRAQAPETGAGLPSARSDYTLENFELTTMGDDGLPRFVLRAPRLERNPIDGSARIESPDLKLYDDAATPAWSVDAETAWIREDGNEIRLDGDVDLVREGQPPTRVDTESLTVFPDRQLASSDESVIIRNAGNMLSGTGLEARLDQNRWELMSDVKARFEPNQ